MVGLGVAVVVVDITVVNVAMPTIVASLDLDFADAEWINATYAVVFASLLITLGRLGDLVGRRALFIGGVVVFAVASIAAGRAGSLASLIGARAVQGLGAAMILPASLALVNTHFRGRHRAIAFGIWGSVIGGVAAIGPLLGGWLATSFGWRWVFLINLPMAVVLVFAAARLLDESRDESAAGFDVPGFAASSLGLFGVVFAVIEGPRYGWLTPTAELGVGALSIVPIALILGLLALAWFVATERRRLAAGRPVLFDLRLFRIPSFAHGNVLASLVGLGEFGLVFVVPIYLQTALAVDAMQTGLVLLAMAVGGLIGGPIAGVLAHRFGPRQVVTTGMALEACGALAVAASLSPDRIAPGLIVGLFVYGVGVGFASSQLASIILVEVPTAASGQASGMQSTFRQVGAALGIATLGMIFITSMSSNAAVGLEGIGGLVDPQRERIVAHLVDSAGWYIHALRAWTPDFAVVVDTVATAITDAARYAALATGIFFAIGTALSRRLPDLMRHGSREPGRRRLHR